VKNRKYAHNAVTTRVSAMINPLLRIVKINEE